MAEGTGILPGLPAVAGKPVHIGFDGGLMTSDAGILLLAGIEQRLGIAERRTIQLAPQIAPSPTVEVSIARPCGPRSKTRSAKPGNNSIKPLN